MDDSFRIFPYQYIARILEPGLVGLVLFLDDVFRGNQELDIDVDRLIG